MVITLPLTQVVMIITRNSKAVSIAQNRQKWQDLGTHNCQNRQLFYLLFLIEESSLIIAIFGNYASKIPIFGNLCTHKIVNYGNFGRAQSCQKWSLNIPAIQVAALIITPPYFAAMLMQYVTDVTQCMKLPVAQAMLHMEPPA